MLRAGTSPTVAASQGTKFTEEGLTLGNRITRHNVVEGIVLGAMMVFVGLAVV